MSQYKAYPKYKDSGIEWIGQVPEHWAIRKVAWDMHMAIGWTPSTDNGRFYGGQHNWVTIADLSSGRITETKTKITDEAIKARGAVPAPIGSVLFSYKLTIGAVALLDEPAYTNEAIVAFHPSSKVVMRWWFYAAPNILLQNAIENIYGAKLLNQEIMASSRFYAPTIKEQTAIAATLDRETARIDALIEKKTRFIELLKEKVIAAAMAEQMYGDGAYIRLRHLVQIISRPVQLISEDEYIALGLYNRGRGLFHKPPTMGKDIGDSDFFYVEEGDLILSGQFAWEGAVTIASSKETGCVVSHRYPILKGVAITTEYLLALLMTNYGDFLLNESSRGSAGRNRPLNINLFLNEKIRMPSDKVQKEISQLIKLKTTLEEKVEQSITLLKERRAAFITAAVTGQIDLRGEY